jgi:hypothetical protein
VTDTGTSTLDPDVHKSEMCHNEEIMPTVKINVKIPNYSFPSVEFRYRNKPSRYGRITQSTKTSSKKEMRFLNMLNKLQNLTQHAKMYTARYKTTYKRLIREAKRKENDKHILQANNKPRAIWWIINKETGKTSVNKQDINIIRSSEEITNPENIAELFNPLLALT